MKQTLISALFALTISFSILGQNRSEKPLSYSIPDINARAAPLVQPAISGEMALKYDGTTLLVKVVVDADGNVVSAKCWENYPKTFIELVEAAARASKFRPLIINGQAVKYDGLLMYTITVQKINWYRFSTALYSAYIFDNLSLSPVAAMLPNEFGVERSKLRDLDNGVDLAVRWKIIENVRELIKGKLQGKDAWWFGLGSAMRDVTSPFQSDKKLDLNDVKTAISNLSKFVESAPSDVPPETIEKLRMLLTYKIDPAMPPEKVGQEIFKLSSLIQPQ